MTSALEQLSMEPAVSAPEAPVPSSSTSSSLPTMACHPPAEESGYASDMSSISVQALSSTPALRLKQSPHFAAPPAQFLDCSHVTSTPVSRPRAFAPPNAHRTIGIRLSNSFLCSPSPLPGKQNGLSLPQLHSVRPASSCSVTSFTSDYHSSTSIDSSGSAVITQEKLSSPIATAQLSTDSGCASLWSSCTFPNTSSASLSGSVSVTAAGTSGTAGPQQTGSSSSLSANIINISKDYVVAEDASSYGVVPVQPADRKIRFESFSRSSVSQILPDNCQHLCKCLLEESVTGYVNGSVATSNQPSLVKTFSFSSPNLSPGKGSSCIGYSAACSSPAGSATCESTPLLPASLSFQPQPSCSGRVPPSSIEIIYSNVERSPSKYFLRTSLIVPPKFLSTPSLSANEPIKDGSFICVGPGAACKSPSCPDIRLLMSDIVPSKPLQRSPLKSNQTSLSERSLSAEIKMLLQSKFDDSVLPCQDNESNYQNCLLKKDGSKMNTNTKRLGLEKVKRNLRLDDLTSARDTEHERNQGDPSVKHEFTDIEPHNSKRTKDLVTSPYSKLIEAASEPLSKRPLVDSEESEEPLLLNNTNCQLENPTTILTQKSEQHHKQQQHPLTHHDEVATAPATQPQTAKEDNDLYSQFSFMPLIVMGEDLRRVSRSLLVRLLEDAPYLLRAVLLYLGAEDLLALSHVNRGLRKAVLGEDKLARRVALFRQSRAKAVDVVGKENMFCNGKRFHQPVSATSRHALGQLNQTAVSRPRPILPPSTLLRRQPLPPPPHRDQQQQQQQLVGVTNSTLNKQQFTGRSEVKCSPRKILGAIQSAVVMGLQAMVSPSKSVGGKATANNNRIVKDGKRRLFTNDSCTEPPPSKGLSLKRNNSISSMNPAAASSLQRTGGCASTHQCSASAPQGSSCSSTLLDDDSPQKYSPIKLNFFSKATKKQLRRL